VTPKDHAKKGCVLVADGIADFLHGAVVVFKQTLGGSDAEFLQIDQRAVSGCLLEAPNEIAQAHADTLCRCLKREGLMKILVQPLLGDRDGRVGMLGLQWHDSRKVLE